MCMWKRIAGNDKERSKGILTDELNRFSLDMAPLNVDRIQSWIDQGRLDPSQPITIKELCSSRCLHGIKDGVKLLARVWHYVPTF